MGLKRSADASDLTRLRPRREGAKRAKLSPATDENSSEPSSCSVSVDSALQSSPPASEHTRQSSLSSLHPPSHDEDDDSIDGISSSTNDDSTDEESDDGIITIGGPKKPDISHSRFRNGLDDLRARLDTLLPQLAAANQTLSDGPNTRTMEDVEDDEQHIEMNLGLGVLEAKDVSDSSSSSGGSSASEGEFEDLDGPASSGAATRSKEDRQFSVMDDLLGKPASQAKATIEELG